MAQEGYKKDEAGVGGKNCPLQPHLTSQTQQTPSQDSDVQHASAMQSGNLDVLSQQSTCHGGLALVETEEMHEISL